MILSLFSFCSCMLTSRFPVWYVLSKSMSGNGTTKGLFAGHSRPKSTFLSSAFFLHERNRHLIDGIATSHHRREQPPQNRFYRQRRLLVCIAASSAPTVSVPPSPSSLFSSLSRTDVSKTKALHLFRPLSPLPPHCLQAHRKRLLPQCRIPLYHKPTFDGWHEPNFCEQEPRKR